MSSSTTELARTMAAAWSAGETERVIALAARADAEDEGVLLLLGLAQQATGRHRQAAATFRQLAQMRPGISAYWNNLAVACRQAGDLPASEQALLTALSLAPDDAEVHYNLGLLYAQQRRWLPARETLLDAVQLAPHFIEARLQAAHACYVCGDNTQQEVMLSGAGDWPAQPAEQALLLSAMLSVQGDLDAALRTLAHAQLPADAAAGAMHVRIAAQRVLLYERNNQIDAAQDELRQLPMDALDALPPDAQQARADGWRAHAALAMRRGAYADAEALYQRVLACAIDDESRASAAFGLASARDRQGRFPEAWQALQQAHAMQLDIARNVVPELLAPDSQPLQMTGSYVEFNTLADWKPLSSPGSRQSPVFVVGFPRSGTTLLEQMLDAHPDFQSMDERAYIHDLIEGMELVGQQYPADLASLAPAGCRPTAPCLLAHGRRGAARPRRASPGRQESAQHAVPADDHAVVSAGAHHPVPAPPVRCAAQLQHATVPLTGLHGAVFVAAAPGTGLCRGPSSNGTATSRCLRRRCWSGATNPWSASSTTRSHAWGSSSKPPTPHR